MWNEPSEERRRSCIETKSPEDYVENPELIYKEETTVSLNKKKTVNSAVNSVNSVGDHQGSKIKNLVETKTINQSIEKQINHTLAKSKP